MVVGSLTPGREVDVSERDERLREAARKAAAGQDIEDNLRFLVGELLPIVDRTAFVALRKNALSTVDARMESEIVADRMLEQKLQDPRWLSTLADHAAPIALVRRTTYNLAIDHLRRLPHVTRDQSSAEGGFATDSSADGPIRATAGTAETTDLHRTREAPGGVHDDPDDEAVDVPREDPLSDAPESDLSASVIRAMHDAIAALEQERLIEFEVWMAHAHPPSEEHVMVLARRRGVDPGVVREELQRRCMRSEEAASLVEAELEKRHLQLMRTQRRLRWIRSVIDAAGDECVAPAIEMSPERVTTLLRSNEALWGATPAERAALLVRYERRLEKQARAIDELRERRADVPGGQDWDEVAEILGLVNSSTTPTDRKRIVNTLTARLLRLRARLQLAFHGADDGD